MKLQLTDTKAFIFDMDGVLIDSEPFYIQVEQQNFKTLGLNITPAEHQKYQGVATDVMWKELKIKYSLQQSVDELVNLTLSEVIPYFSALGTIELMPGVINLIQILSERGFPLAVASSSFPEVIAMALEKTGISNYFKTIVSSKDAGNSKPAPDVFLKAAENLTVAAENCIVIEDSQNGIRAAKSAGMFCIAYAGPGSEHQDQSQADWIITDFDEIVKAIKF